MKFFIEAISPSVAVFRDLVFFKVFPYEFFLNLENTIVQNEKFIRENFTQLVESFYSTAENHWRGLCVDWNFLEKPEAEEYVWTTLISNDSLGIYKNAYQIQESLNSDTVIIFIGGGGFIASTKSLQEMFLRDYCNSLGCSIFEFHYKLAPEKKYPYQIHEMVELYLGILMYYRHYLGIELKKIVLMGDSAGGNLVMGLTNLLILFKQRVPDYLILVYPATNLNESRFTPSLLNSFNERLLYFTVLEKCLAHYVDEAFNPQRDWILSPGITPDEILSKYPKTDVFCGEFDPLFDDCYRLAYRLNELKVACEMTIFHDLYHGFLSFDLPFGQGISEVSKIHEVIKTRIRIFLSN